MSSSTRGSRIFRRVETDMPTDEGRQWPNWKEIIMLLVGLVSLVGWIFPFTGAILGYTVWHFTSSFKLHASAALLFLLAVALFHHYVPFGYPVPIRWLAIPSYCCGYWLHRRCQQIIITPESS